MNRREAVQLEPGSAKKPLDSLRPERTPGPQPGCYLDEKLRAALDRMKALEEPVFGPKTGERQDSAQPRILDSRTIDCCCEYEMLRAAVTWLGKAKAALPIERDSQALLQYIRDSLKQLTQLASTAKENRSWARDSARNGLLQDIAAQATRLQIVLNCGSQAPRSPFAEEPAEPRRTKAASRTSDGSSRQAAKRLRRLAKHALHAFQRDTSLTLKRLSGLLLQLPSRSLGEQLQRLVARCSQNLAIFSGAESMGEFEAGFVAYLATQELIADDLSQLLLGLARAAVRV